MAGKLILTSNQNTLLAIAANLTVFFVPKLYENEILVLRFKERRDYFMIPWGKTCKALFRQAQ